MPSSFATDLLGIPSAHRRMARHRSDNDRATRRPRTCRFRYARSSLLRTKAAIGRPTTLASVYHHITGTQLVWVQSALARVTSAAGLGHGLRQRIRTFDAIISNAEIERLSN